MSIKIPTITVEELTNSAKKLERWPGEDVVLFDDEDGPGPETAEIDTELLDVCTLILPAQPQ